MSGDRLDIDVSLVRRLIADQFPRWEHLPIHAVEPGGWDNRTFRLGDDMSVRLPSAERYAAQVEKEHRWLPRLAPHLPVTIPEPIAMGAPVHGYPWRWSVYRWIGGETASVERIGDMTAFAETLAGFLRALWEVDTDDAPTPGAQNFYRGGPVATYDAETRHAIASLRDEIDARAVTSVWEAALASRWERAPVWVHGDVTASNLLVRDGGLSAVIDFGSSGVGDPACDLTMAWTFFTAESRPAFLATIAVDDRTWARARGWAAWKALITLADHRAAHAETSPAARHVLDEVSGGT